MLKIIAFLVLLTSLFTGIAFGQDYEELRELSLEDLMDTEVVSATQTAMRLQEAPSTVFVVTGKQIRRWGIRRLSELIERLVPGAFVVEDGDDVILGFRGIAADNNAKVLLLLNGHYYNAQWNNGPNSEVELGLMQDIKRVEVINGPGGALYGAGAIIGIINIITRSGKDFRGVEAGGNYGSGDYQKGEIILGSETNETDYFASLGGLTADGYDNLNRDPLNISRFEPSYRFYGNINYNDFELSTRFTRSGRALYSSPPNLPTAFTFYDTFFVDGKYTLEPSDDLKLVTTLTLDTLQTQRHDYRLGMKIRGVGEQRYGLGFTGFFTGIRNQEFVFGTEYRRDEFGADWSGDNFELRPRVENGVIVGVPADKFSSRTLTPYGRNVFGLFAQDMFTLNPKNTLLLGLRLDYIEAPGVDESFDLTPRVAFVHKPNHRTILKAMYTTGFRQPTGVVTSPDGFFFGTQHEIQISEPEKMHSIEFGASTRTGKFGSVGLNLYYNILTQIHGLDPQQSQVPVFVSSGRIDFWGFEAFVDHYFQENFLLKVAHQFVHTGSVVNDSFKLHTVEDGDHIFAYPENVTKVLVDIPLTSRLSVNSNANLIWNSFGLDESSNVADSGFYMLWNTNAIIQINRQSNLMLSVYNITDEDPRIPLTVRFFTKVAERNYNLSFEYRF